MMPKEKVLFPWDIEKENNNTLDEESKAENSHDRLLRITKTYGPYFLIALLLVISVMAKSDTKAPPGPPPLEAFVSPIAIRKGASLNTSMLRIVHVRKKQLSAKQELKLLRREDLRQQKHELVAKRDIAPRKPIFWSDLKIKEAEKVKPRSQNVFYRRSKDD